MINQGVGSYGGKQLPLSARWQAGSPGLARPNPFNWLIPLSQSVTLEMDPVTSSVEERPLSLGQKAKHSDDKKERQLEFSMPATLTQSCSVMTGDTLPSIAQSLYGSESYASSIAQANGLDDDSSIYPGYPGLHLPAFIQSRNLANQYHPTGNLPARSWVLYTFILIRHKSKAKLIFLRYLGRY